MTVAVLYTIAVLVVGGTILLAIRRWLKARWSALASLGVGLAALLPLLLVHSDTMEVTLARWLPTERWAILASYRFDTVSQAFGLLAAGAALLLLVWMALTEEEGTFSPWVLLLLAIFLHLVSCTDLILTYASWEVLLIVTYWMLVSRRSSLPTPGIAEWFLGSQHLAGYLLLFALLLIGRAAGTTLYPVLDIGAVGTIPLLLALGTIWIRTAQVPFQGWALAVAESPGPVHTLVLGGLNLLAGPYVWMRFLSRVGTHLPHEVTMVVGAVSLLVGAVLALRRESSRQVQAGDTVSRMGLVWIALGLDGQLGLAAGLLLLLDLLLSKVLFHVALSSNRGVERPARQGLFLLASWGAVGLPPSPGFFGRWLLLVGLLRLGRPAYLPLVLLALPLTVAYLWRGWTWLPQTQDRPVRSEMLGARAMAGLLSLAPLVGLAVPWLWQRFFERATIVTTGISSIEVRLLFRTMAGGMAAWVVLLLFVGALGSWWLGAWRGLSVVSLLTGEATATGQHRAQPAVIAETTAAPGAQAAVVAEATAAPGAQAAVVAEATAAPGAQAAVVAETTAAPGAQAAVVAETTAAPGAQAAVVAETTAAPGAQAAATAETTVALEAQSAVIAETTVALEAQSAVVAAATAVPGVQAAAAAAATAVTGAQAAGQVEGAAVSVSAALSAGPLQEALPILPQESSWLAWLGRPAQLYRALAQAFVWLGQLFQSIATFLERHTTYFLLVVLVAATIILIVLTR